MYIQNTYFTVYNINRDDKDEDNDGNVAETHIPKSE